MTLKLQTKEESNKLREEAFLQLSGAERVWHFFRLSAQVNKFPVKHKKTRSDNFEIRFPAKK